MNDKDLYVQYGCGWSVAEGWKNFDASPTLRIEKLPLFGSFLSINSQRFPKQVEYGDIVKGLPLQVNSCKGIYCSHILEHLSLNDFRTALKNTYQILKKDGEFRLVVPDLEFLIKTYTKSTETDASINFLTDSYLGRVERKRTILGKIRESLGNSNHLWMWDYKSIEVELQKAGFINIRRASFSDSNDSMFVKAESEDRWIDNLGVSCSK